LSQYFFTKTLFIKIKVNSVQGYSLNKKVLSSSLLILLIGGFALASITLFTVQADTNVTGIITSDTTWTKANSPYSLTGPVAVNSGITLTIEAGVQVYFNTYYLQVNGSARKHFSTGFVQTNNQL